MAIINGTNKSDHLFGTEFADLIKGLKGHDTIHGGSDNDLIFAGKGNDLVFGDGGDDLLFGDLHNDYLNGSGASYYGYGTGEYDELTGGGGADTFSLVTDISYLATGQKIGNVAYLYDDVLDVVGSRGFALIHDFNLMEGDTIELDGYASHYALTPLSWSQTYGSASLPDTAIKYIGPEQDKSEVIGVLKDVSLGSAYLETHSFTYLG